MPLKNSLSKFGYQGTIKENEHTTIISYQKAFTIIARKLTKIKLFAGMCTLILQVCASVTMFSGTKRRPDGLVKKWMTLYFVVCTQWYRLCGKISFLKKGSESNGNCNWHFTPLLYKVKAFSL